MEKPVCILSLEVSLARKALKTITINSRTIRNNKPAKAPMTIIRVLDDTSVIATTADVDVST